MTVIPWMRATSPMAKPKRRASSSPPWGPLPVTIVPVTMTTIAQAARPSAKRRSASGTVGR